MNEHNAVFTTIAKLFELTCGIICLSTGVTFGILSGLGQTTSTSTSSAIAAASGLRVGTAMFLLYGLFLAGQILLLGRKFQKIRFLQLIPVFLQMVILNYLKYDFAPFQNLHPSSYPECFILLTAGILLISLGFTIVKYSYFLNYPPEAFMGILSERFGIKFGYVKIIGDIVYVLASVLICLLCGIDLTMVREGTLIFALLNGFLINFYTPYVLKSISAFEKLVFRGFSVRLLLSGSYQYHRC